MKHMNFEDGDTKSLVNMYTCTQYSSHVHMHVLLESSYTFLKLLRELLYKETCFLHKCVEGIRCWIGKIAHRLVIGIYSKALDKCSSQEACKG